MTMQGDPGAGAGAGGAPTGGAPAGGAPAPSGAPSAGAAPTAPAWLEGVPQDLAQWVGEQGFKSVADVVASQRGLMRMKGVPESELLHLKPKWDETPETAAAIYARLGRPEKPDGYELPNLPVAEGGLDLTPGFRAKAHELGLSSRAAKGLAEWFAGEGQTFAAAQSEALEQRDTQQELALKAEWGGAFDENIGAGKRAWSAVAANAGLDGKDIETLQRSWGYAKVMKLFATMGRALGEHDPVGGEPEMAFGMTPAVATQKADALTAELSKMDRYDPTYQAKLDEVQRLRHMATGEQLPKWSKRG